MPDIWQDKAYWEQYLRLYCKSRSGIEGAALATANGVIIAAVMPTRVDLRLLAAQVTAFASSGYAIAVELKRGGDAPIIFMKTEFGYVFICFDPVRAKVLVTLCSDNAKIGKFMCPDFGDPPATSDEYAPIGRPPKHLSAEAEAEIDE